MKTISVTSKTTMGVSALATVTGHDRATVAKRLQTHFVQACGQKGNSPQYRLVEAIRAIYAADEHRGANTRLARARADRIAQQMEADSGLKNGELIRTCDAIEIFKTGVAMLDEISPRVRSALALTDKQTAALEKFIGGIGKEWAEKIKSIGTPAAGG